MAVPVLPGDAHQLCTEFEQVAGRVLFEGDIVLGRCRQDTRGTWQFDPRGAFAEKATGLRSTKAAVAPTSWYWPGGAVPYTVSNELSEVNAPVAYGQILSAIHHWNAQSVVQLVPRTNEAHYVEFVADLGCWSFLGRAGGNQPIGLYADGRCGFGATVHEIGHALGFYHEQSRQDRDGYVTILWENIQDGREFNFEMYNSGSDPNAYDYGSIMHYGLKSFAVAGSPPPDTIVADSAHYEAWKAIYGDVPIGQRSELSVLDRRATDEMYNVCWSGPSAATSYWQANAWRSCSSSCAAPGRTREVFCHAANGACTGDNSCAAAARPAPNDSCAALLDCDFENGNCAWDSTDSEDDFNWTPSNGATTSGGTGPSADHTSGSGDYLYTEMSSPRQPGDVANLTSVPVDIPGGVTLEFWYHYYGTSLPTLEVQLVPCGGGEQTLLTISPGNTTSLDAWRQASVQLPAGSAARIRFKVTRAVSWSGDVAIDDITVSGMAAGESDMIFADGFESADMARWSAGG